MAAGEQRNVHDVEQFQKVIPFVTSNCLFDWNVGKLAPGIDVVHLDFSGQDLFRRITSQEQLCRV